MKSIAIAIGCLPEVEGSPHCWKLHAFQSYVPEISELELIWMPPLWKLAFLFLEGNMQAPKGEKQLAVLPSYDNDKS